MSPHRPLPRSLLPVFVSALLLGGCLLPGDSSTDDDDATASPDWTPEVLVSQVPTGEIGGTPYNSSSRLQVEWSAAPSGLQGIVLDITDESTGLAWSIQAEADSSTLTLSELKSATTYAVSVEGCTTSDCAERLGGGATATGTTAEEVWQLLGSGNDIEQLTNIVPDSNAKAHAFVYGDSAPVELRGRLQLYYGAMGGYGGSLSVATSNRAADPDDETSYSDFTSYVGSSGVIEPDSPSTLVEWIGTGQGVPLHEDLGGGIRLFFEARGADGRTRIMSLDSQDGDLGLDFHSGDAGHCSLASDYETGGGCHPHVEIGVEGDAEAPAQGIDNARQQKVGVPTLTDWRWGGEPGSFMVFTTGPLDGCSDSQKNHGYALYDGTSWSVQYADDGCPKLFSGVQAMAPLHLGQGAFKIQFGNPDEDEGSTGGRLPFLGPKRVVYGDAARSGDPEVLDFEDWDPVDQARDLTFLWPDGGVLDARAEGYIDDFVVLTPTFDPDHQVQLVVLTDGERVPFTSVAVLRNR